MTSPRYWRYHGWRKRDVAGLALAVVAGSIWGGLCVLRDAVAQALTGERSS